mgnify:FL=1
MFSAVLAWLLSNPTIIAIIAAVVGALGYGYSQRRAGAAKEKARQDRERLAARSEADKIDQAVAGMTDEEVLREQAKWSRKR